MLAETDAGWAVEQDYSLRLTVTGNRLTAYVDGQQVLDAIDPEAALAGGGVALVAQTGCIYFDDVSVRPV